ncbi:hypothetical protein [Halorussus aquaticus]|uniref:Uncharacterized protein n=1 Tax=Halorussus aquaticus TaxID=2953748 RepID=A0ABD5Q599_9EURY|nr:hypothetical protein [Halorussus aquaticus]
MRRRTLLTTVWAGLLAGCSGQDGREPTQTETETTHGYGGTVTTEITTARTTGVPGDTTTPVESSETTTSASDEYGVQGYGTLGYGG